jgi:hypothetical protein
VHLTDIIDVSGIDASATLANDQQFIFDAIAHNGSGQVAAGHIGFFQTNNGHTIIEGNIAGQGNSVDFQIDLTGINLGLTVQDFHL